LKKRTVTPRMLPDAQLFKDWKTWAQRHTDEVQREIASVASIVPFIEFGTVTRTTAFTPVGANVRWQSIVFDNTPGIWTASGVAAEERKLYVPRRPGDLQYGYAMVIAGIGLTDPTDACTVSGYITKNDVAVMPSSRFSLNVAPGYLFGLAFNLVNPWQEVEFGQYFGVIVEQFPAGIVQVQANVHTFASLILAGPA